MFIRHRGMVLGELIGQGEKLKKTFKSIPAYLRKKLEAY
jgi:hypothetical protein